MTLLRSRQHRPRKHSSPIRCSSLRMANPVSERWACPASEKWSETKLTVTVKEDCMNNALCSGPSGDRG